MRWRGLLALGFLVACVSAAPAQSQAPALSLSEILEMAPAGDWRAVLDLAGGELRFGIRIEGAEDGWKGDLCNGDRCLPFSAIRREGDSLRLEMADYAATITARLSGDSLVGAYRNVGNRGPRTIPFRAARGRWPVTPARAGLTGRWDATYFSDFGDSPRVFDLRNGKAGLEGTIISNTGDYGHFAGQVRGDSFALAHFDGSFVYLLTGAVHGDTLRGIFHAGLRSQTPWIALRSTGRPLGEIVRQPVFIVAVLSGMLGYGSMTLIMTATPLAMKGCGFAFSDTATVIQGHVLAMFLPSFFTGSLIQRFGVLRIIAAGSVLTAGCLAANLSGIAELPLEGSTPPAPKVPATTG